MQGSIRAMFFLVLASFSAPMEVHAQPGLSIAPSKLSVVESEIIVMTHRGFEPRLITRRSGNFRLLLFDIRGNAVTDFEIVDDKGASKQNPKIDKSKAKRLSQELDLSPGTYSLRLRDQPAISMQLVIDPSAK